MSNPSPLVSVVLPVYNVGEYIAECLESLCKQTYDRLEIICIDDGSTDDSVDVIEKYAVGDNRIRLVRQKNCGTVIARNRAVSMTTGDYVMFVDPDDALRLDTIETLINKLKTTPVDILQYGVEVIETYSRSAKQKAVTQKNFNPSPCAYSGYEILPAIFRECKIGWNLIFRIFRGDLVRKAFGEIPDIESINETDALAMFYVACYARSFASIPSRLYRYRYGIGISTKKTYTLAEYRRTLGKIPCAEAVLEYARKNSSQHPAIGECARLIAMRMVGNSWGSAFARMQGEQRIEAAKLLMSATKVDDFVAAMAYKYCRSPRTLIDQLSQTGVVGPCSVKESKRIGIIYHRLTHGGVQRVLTLIFDELIALGHEIVLFLDEHLDDRCYPVPPQIKIVYLPSPVGAGAEPFWRRVLALTAALRENPVDILYSHAYASPALIWDLLVGKLVFHLPYVVHLHSVFTGFLYSQNIATQQRFAFMRHIYRWTDLTITLSRADCAYVQHTGGRAVYMPNPIDPVLVGEPNHPAPENPHHLLWIARLSWEKHPGDAVQIFRKVRENFPDATMTMVGGGDESIARFVHAEAKKCGLDGAIKFTGSITDVYSEYRKAAVFLTTSCIEGFPMTSLEALSFSLPIVAYAIPHLELYRGNHAVFQVAPSQIDAAAEAIVHLMENGLEQARTAARQSVLKFINYDRNAAWNEIFAMLARGDETAGYQTILPDDCEVMMDVLLRGVETAMETAGKKMRALTAEVAENEKVTEEDMLRRNRKLANEISALRNSEAYRTGMLVTWPLRKIYREAKRLFSRI